MTFEEWWDEVGHNMWCDNDDVFLSDVVKAAWEDAYKQGFDEGEEVGFEKGVDYADKRDRDYDKIGC